jgi:hypothetical protein
MAAELMDPKQQLVQTPAREVQELPATMQALMRAIDSEADLERLEKLMELHERFEAGQARKAFSEAMAEFRSEQMTILKTKLVDIPGGAKYFHAELANVCEAVIPALSKYGLRHQWIPRQREDKSIEVTCRITHRLGHFEDTTMFGPPDVSGKKSPIQEVASTVTLLQRYTLLAATGLAAKGMDTDGNVPKTGVTLEEPGDYMRWAADAEAIADEGSARLNELWKKSPEDIRTYTIVARKSWWNDMKAKAEKADKKGGVK